MLNFDDKNTKVLFGTLLGAVASITPTSKDELDKAKKSVEEFLQGLKEATRSNRTAEEFGSDFMTDDPLKDASEKHHKSQEFDWEGIKNENPESTYDSIMSDANISFVEENAACRSEFVVTRDRLQSRKGMRVMLEDVMYMLRTEDKVWIKLLNGKILKNY